jgi:Zn-dependent protease/CBS domain-containing protein
MKHALYLGSILGVKIYVHWTFIFLIGWIVVTGLRSNLPLNAFLWTFGLTLTVFGCIVLHELSHAMVARKFGIATKHITLLPIGGIAQFESAPQKPKHELLIALAGPALNIIIAALLFPFVNVHELIQLESLMTINTTNFLFSLIVINVWLAIFNLIPAFPMDGGRVLRALLSFRIDHAKATKIAAAIGQAFGLVFFFAGFLYNPMLIFIGLLVFLGGQYEYALIDTMRLLQSFTVRDVLMREVPTMINSSTLKNAGDQLLNTQSKNFVVVADGKPVGTINRDEIIQAVHEKGEKERLDKVMITNLTYANESTSLDEAWKMMRDRKVSMLLVGSNGHLQGIVDEENLAEFIQLKSGHKLKENKRFSSSLPG